jgi:hypothetical protein
VTTSTRVRREDRFASARAVADAVLFEGYVLYPYRASARKNQIRWQFGVLAPSRWAEADGSERSANRTEVLVDPGPSPTLRVRIRFLQVQERRIEAAAPGGGFVPVEALPAGGVTHVDFAEAIEHEIDLPALALLPVAQAHAVMPVAVEGGCDEEPITDDDGIVLGRAVRRRAPIAGLVRLVAHWAAGPGALLKVSVDVENTVDDDDIAADRDVAMRRSLVAVHTLLAVDDGVFVSLLDPPDYAAEAAADCRSEGSYPVLVGPPGATDPTADVVLSSPIILYDHPAVAPESQGDMFDATEIDEILALRVLTLTDAEKAEARGTDARAAAIVDRCDDLPPEVWERLHGAIRSISPSTPDPDPAEPGAKPWWDPGMDGSVDPFEDTTTIGGRVVGRGTRVVLRPTRRADAHDMFLAGQPATVAGVFQDVEGSEHLAVTLDNDPAAELYGSTGRFYYFTPDEVEVVVAEPPTGDAS